MHREWEKKETETDKDAERRDEIFKKYGKRKNESRNVC